MVQPIDDPEVAAVFASHPPKFRRKLLALRRLILETAGLGAVAAGAALSGHAGGPVLEPTP